MKTLLLSSFLLVCTAVLGQTYAPCTKLKLCTPKNLDEFYFCTEGSIKSEVNTSCTSPRIEHPKAFGYIPNDRSEGLFNSKIVDRENTYFTEPMRGVWSETIEKEQQTIIPYKTIKEYVDWCYKDSMFVERWKDAYYTLPDSIGINGSFIFHPAQYIKIWEHKEPTFIGFYEWLKDKNK